MNNHQKSLKLGNIYRRYFFLMDLPHQGYLTKFSNRKRRPTEFKLMSRAIVGESETLCCDCLQESGF